MTTVASRTQSRISSYFSNDMTFAFLAVQVPLLKYERAYLEAVLNIYC